MSKTTTPADVSKPDCSNGDIKDYLPFYLGCDIQLWHVGNSFTTIKLDTNNLHRMITGSPAYAGVIHRKPILRPLSDMTEDEKVILYTLMFKKHTVSILGGGEFVKRTDAIEFITMFVTGKHPMTDKEFLWLLKNGFDLFDLIESGLAIDKTKSTQ